MSIVLFYLSHTTRRRSRPNGEREQTSIMMTAREMVRRVTPPMKAPAPMRAKAPGSTHDHGLGGRNTPGGALHMQKGRLRVLVVLAQSMAISVVPH